MSRDFENAVIVNLLLLFLYIASSFAVFSAVSGETTRHLITVDWSLPFGFIQTNDPLDGIHVIFDYSYLAFILSTVVNLYIVYRITKSKELKNKEPKKEHTYGFGS
jgi:hypothetical protein